MPIIEEKSLSPADLQGIRDPLVGQDISASQPIVQCINCDTLYFRSSYDSLVQSNRGQCLNCKGDKYSAVNIARRRRKKGQETSNASGAKPHVKHGGDPGFLVPLSQHSPILPGPSYAEEWEETYGKDVVRKIGALKLGGGGQQWSTPPTFLWRNEKNLLLGKDERIYEINANTGRSSCVFYASKWRDRSIHDFSIINKGHDIIVVGNCFRAKVVGNRWRAGYDIEYYCDPDCNKIVASPDGKFVVHSAEAQTYERKKFPLSFMINGGDDWERRIIIANTKNYNVEREIVIDDMMRILWSVIFEISPTGRFLGIHQHGYNDDFVFAIDLKTREDRVNPQDYRVINSGDIWFGHLAWHPTRDVYATCYYGENAGPPHGFWIVDAASNKIILDQPIDRRGKPLSLAWSPDGKYLAMGGHDQAIFVWDFEDGSARKLLGHRGAVTSLFFSPDGQRLASSSEDDGQICIWGMNLDERPIHAFEGRFGHDLYYQLRGSPWSPEGRKLVGCIGGSLRVVQMV